jgi:hypothetical protein
MNEPEGKKTTIRRYLGATSPGLNRVLDYAREQHSSLLWPRNNERIKFYNFDGSKLILLQQAIESGVTSPEKSVQGPIL